MPPFLFPIKIRVSGAVSSLAGDWRQFPADPAEMLTGVMAPAERGIWNAFDSAYLGRAGLGLDEPSVLEIRNATGTEWAAHDRFLIGILKGEPWDFVRRMAEAHSPACSCDTCIEVLEVVAAEVERRVAAAGLI